MNFIVYSIVVWYFSITSKFSHKEKNNDKFTSG